MLVQTTAALALLFVGGELLVRGASALALRLGISPLAVGLTVVAFGTSAPELVVSLDAVLAGAGDIAVGNVVGSNIANVALILGLCALLRPSHVEAKVVRLDVPLMILASLLLVFALLNGRIGRVEGGLLLLGLAAYTGFTFWESRRESDAVRREFVALTPQATPAAGRSLLYVAAGLAALVGGGHLLVGAAVELATAAGLSQATVGLTIVAVGTSLPELATSLVASFRRQGDIAVGNIVGSNLFNILGIVGTTALVRPLLQGGITGTDLGVMLGLSFALLAMLYIRPGLARLEGGVLLVAYAGYVAWLLVG